MTSHNEHSVSREEVYVDRGSLTWWLTNPSDELSNFCVQYLLKLKWLTNKLVFNNMIGVWRAWLLINTLQTHLFACDKHIRWCRKKTIQFVVNTLYKKKLKWLSAKIRSWVHLKIDKGPKNTDQICCFNPFWRNFLFILSSGIVSIHIQFFADFFKPLLIIKYEHCGGFSIKWNFFICIVLWINIFSSIYTFIPI